VDAAALVMLMVMVGEDDDDVSRSSHFRFCWGGGFLPI